MPSCWPQTSPVRVGLWRTNIKPEKQQGRDKRALINADIKHREVRLIDQNGEQVGIVAIREALAAAEAVQLDLVEIVADAEPPVCRIMDYGKFKYQVSKKQHEAKKKQTIIKVKEIKLRPKTEEHDYQFKLKHARQFLEDGNKVKVTVQYRGREMAYTHLGIVLLERFLTDANDLGQVEQAAKAEGRTAHMILAPIKK